MTPLEYGQKARAAEDGCLSGIEKCSRSARRLLAFLIVGGTALVMAAMMILRLFPTASESISFLLDLTAAAYALWSVFMLSRVYRRLYWVRRVYHRDMKALYEQFQADDAAKASDMAEIKPHDIELYDHAAIDWKPSVTVPVVMLLCALLILPYYYVDIHTTFTPKGWQEYNGRWSCYMAKDLRSQQSDGTGGGQFNLWFKTSEQVREIMYREEYADIPVDFTAVSSNPVFVPEYDAYYLYTDDDGKNHWLVYNLHGKEKIMFPCTGEECCIPS